MPDDSRLDIRYEKGTGDMGSMTAGRSVGGPPPVEDSNYAARFPVKRARQAISSLRVHFAGGTGTNPLTINIASHRGLAYDVVLATITARGTGADVTYGVPLEQEDQFYVEKGDEVVVIWTNPHALMEWGIILALKNGE